MRAYENDTSEFSASTPVVRLGLLIGLGLLVCVPYFALERHHLFPAMEVQLTPVDRYVPFVQPTIWAYHLTQLHKLIWSRLPRSVSGRSYLGFLARFLRATPRLDETPIGLENTTGKSA